jgi:hypothetical protein
MNLLSINVEVESHFVHDNLVNKKIVISYVKSEDQLAVLFIKALGHG